MGTLFWLYVQAHATFSLLLEYSTDSLVRRVKACFPLACGMFRTRWGKPSSLMRLDLWGSRYFFAFGLAQAEQGSAWFLCTEQFQVFFLESSLTIGILPQFFHSCCKQLDSRLAI